MHETSSDVYTFMYVEHILISIHTLHLADKFSIVSTAPEEKKGQGCPLPPFSQFQLSVPWRKLSRQQRGKPFTFCFSKARVQRFEIEHKY